MNKGGAYILIVIAGCVAGMSCGHEPEKAVTKKAEHTFTMNGSVREIKIQPEMPEFPEKEGKQEFVSYCSMCHSLKYITMQPDFPRKVWEAELEKMVVKYKAPIDSATGKKIVDYIVMVKPGQ